MTVDIDQLTEPELVVLNRRIVERLRFLQQGNRVNAPLLNAVHPTFVMPGLDPGILTDTAARDGRGDARP